MGQWSELGSVPVTEPLWRVSVWHLNSFELSELTACWTWSCSVLRGNLSMFHWVVGHLGTWLGGSLTCSIFAFCTRGKALLILTGIRDGLCKYFVHGFCQQQVGWCFLSPTMSHDRIIYIYMPRFGPNMVSSSSAIAGVMTSHGLSPANIFFNPKC